MDRWNVVLGVDVSKKTIDICWAEHKLFIQISNNSEGLLPAFAYLIMVVYDTPVRNYLNRKRIGKDDSYSVIDDRAATNASRVIAAANDR